MTAVPLIGDRSWEVITYHIDLPFPVSANRLWRYTGKVRHTPRGSALCAPRVHLSAEYESWIREADGLYLTQRRKIGPVQTLGRYTLACVFSREKRSPLQDGDNLCKCLHDWLERVEIIRNDCLCEGGSWTWGEALTGASVAVTGQP